MPALMSSGARRRSPLISTKQDIGNVEWQELQPDAKHNWLTEGRHDAFDTLLPIGNKETKEGSDPDDAIFRNYGRGVETTRDAWLYNYQKEKLAVNIERFIGDYNDQVHKWVRQKRRAKVRVGAEYLTPDKKPNKFWQLGPESPK